MKKLYYLIILFTSLVNAQYVVDFEDGSKTGYATGNVTLNGIDWEFADALIGTSASDFFNGTKSARLRGYATSALTMLANKTNGIGNITFQYRQYGTDAQLGWKVEYSTNDGATWLQAGANFTATATVQTFNATVNVTGNARIRIVRDTNDGNTANRRTNIDDISITDFTGTPTPGLTITSPSNGTVFNPTTTSVPVAISVSNFVVGTPGPGIDGHIHYTINGGATVMKYDTTPINVPVTAGTSYTIAMQLVDNMHNPLSTPVTANVSFSVAGYTVVSNIGALRADVVANGPGNYYQITGEALVSYTRPATRNQKYIQDATGGILIDDNSNVITNTFNIGDGMINFRGQTSIFNGVLQIIPLENTAVNSTGNTITPQIVTVADLTAGNLEPYESKLVQINNVTFADGNGTNTFAVNTNYNISDGTTMAFRTIFAEADYVVNANLIPTGPTSIAVIVAEFNGTPQVVARNLSEITLSTNSFNAIDGLKMYPNPVSGNVLNLTSTANESMSVQIFDILGKEVVSANVINNQVNVSGLNAGVYIVKVTEAGKTATRKLVVK